MRNQQTYEPGENYSHRGKSKQTKNYQKLQKASNLFHQYFPLKKMFSLKRTVLNMTQYTNKLIIRNDSV